ncbi:MAG: J domain-containing protein [Chloroflexota bacterium]|nr:J domain-containing protein [Chloroflexota bacterium]
MVLPLLYGLGAKDYIELRGYLLGTCQQCKSSGVFAVYDAKRKVTFWSMPTVAVRDQLVVECRTCNQRFAVPAEMRDEFNTRILTEEQVTARVHELRGRALGAGGRPGGRTLYQILQVDTAADPEVIDAAFRRLALKYHPDRSTDPAAPDRMRELLEAKRILADPSRRRAYDRSLGIPYRPPAMRANEV